MAVTRSATRPARCLETIHRNYLEAGATLWRPTRSPAQHVQSRRPTTSPTGPVSVPRGPAIARRVADEMTTTGPQALRAGVSCGPGTQPADLGHTEYQRQFATPTSGAALGMVEAGLDAILVEPARLACTQLRCLVRERAMEPAGGTFRCSTHVTVETTAQCCWAVNRCGADRHRAARVDMIV